MVKMMENRTENRCPRMATFKALLHSICYFFVAPEPFSVKPRPCTMRWRKASVSSPHLPPTSRASTSTVRRHRRARWNSGWGPMLALGRGSHAYWRRWGQMLAVAEQGAFAASLCQLPTDVGDAYASAPLEGDVLSDASWAPGA